MLRGSVVGLVSAALLVGGCGDDDGGGSAANDQQTVDAAIAALEQSLRDDGFSVTAEEDQDDDLVFESQECREFDQAFPGDQNIPGETASAESDDFERELGSGGGVQELVQAFAGFVEEPGDLDLVVELFTDERFGPCLEEAFRVGIEAAAAEDQAPAELGDVAIEQLGSEGLGDTGGGVQLTGQVTTSGFAVPFSFAFQFVRADRALVGIFTSGVGPDEPSIDRAALLEVLVDGVSDQST
jgi:hypothetical protein